MTVIVSTTIKHDDGTYETVYPESAIPELDLYDNNGFSQHPDFACCFRIKKVDEFVARLAIGDEFDQEVAAGAARYFAMVVPEYEGMEQREGANWFKVHWNQPQQIRGITGYLGSGKFVPFYPSTSITVDQSKTPDEAQQAYGPPAEGILTPVWGWNPGDDRKWAGDDYITALQRQVTALRNWKPGMPKISPGES